MKVILLILIGFGLGFADLSRASNGIVADSGSGLSWQDDYSDNSGNIKSATWADAITYCEDLTLGSHSDWRLPNINELYSIVDDTKYNPAISAIFTKVTSGYWSSTTVASVTSVAWSVNFGYGNDNWGNKSNSDYVRCVRGGQ